MAGEAVRKPDGMRYSIPAAEIEFDEGGHTIWVHSPEGLTILRIKCSGKITVDKGCVNLCPHSDMMVQGNINVCLPSNETPLLLAGDAEGPLPPAGGRPAYA